MTRAMLLSELLPELEGLSAELAVTGLVQDSREVAPGDAFVAIAGFGAHGLHFVDAARAAGASAILFEPLTLPDEVGETLLRRFELAGECRHPVTVGAGIVTPVSKFITCLGKAGRCLGLGHGSSRRADRESGGEGAASGGEHFHGADRDSRGEGSF